jgi:hypothetical protein
VYVNVRSVDVGRVVVCFLLTSGDFYYVVYYGTINQKLKGTVVYY